MVRNNQRNTQNFRKGRIGAIDGLLIALVYLKFSVSVLLVIILPSVGRSRRLTSTQQLNQCANAVSITGARPPLKLLHHCCKNDSVKHSPVSGLPKNKLDS